jgi:hypothetical protein
VISLLETTYSVRLARISTIVSSDIADDTALLDARISHRLAVIVRRLRSEINFRFGSKADVALLNFDVRFTPPKADIRRAHWAKADIANLLEKRPFLASSPQIAATRLRRPKCFAYRLAHALIPPASFINAFSRVSGCLCRAA